MTTLDARTRSTGAGRSAAVERRAGLRRAVGGSGLRADHGPGARRQDLLRDLPDGVDRAHLGLGSGPPGGGALQLLPLLVAGPGTGPHRGGTGRDGPGGREVGSLRWPPGGSRPRARPRRLTRRPENGTEPTPPSPPGKAVGSARGSPADAG